jgi:hypothetical protein
VARLQMLQREHILAAIICQARQCSFLQAATYLRFLLNV